MKKSKNPILTTKEAASLLRVGVQTVKNYIYQGKIRSFKTPGGHHRIPRSELPNQVEEDFMRELKKGTDSFIGTDGISDNLPQGLHHSYVVIIKALVMALDRSRDSIGINSERIAGNCLKIADALKLDTEERKTLELAALLHDIGNIGVSERILAKPGKLTEEEYNVIKEHSLIGEKIVSEIQFLEKTRSLIRHHHERFDGRGYPDKLSGEEIPLGARVIAVTTVYQALVSDGPYRKAYSEDHALKIIQENSGTGFDPGITHRKRP